MVDSIINREIVNGTNNTVNVETTLDAAIINGVGNTINQSIVEGEFTEWNAASYTYITYNLSGLFYSMIDEANKILWLFGANNTLSFNLLTGSQILSSGESNQNANNNWGLQGFSIFGKYSITYNIAAQRIRVYKNGTLLTSLVEASSSACYISLLGKYIIAIRTGRIDVFVGS